MKHLLLTLLIACAFVNCKSQNYDDTQKIRKADSIDKVNAETIKLSGKYIQKVTVSKKDSTMWLIANMKLDHRIFGYEKPDINSKKKILISIFTNDVEGNPFNCPLGSYYQTSGMKNMEMKFISKEGSFIKAKIVKNDLPKEIIYILKKWVTFEK